MKAVRISETDGTEAVTYEDAPRPELDSDELLVRVRAAGVNPLDWLVCRGDLPSLLDKPLPWIPGWDVSGVVESVGTEATGFEPGDAVYGMVRLPGAGETFAEYAAMKADEVAPKPPSLTHTEAAGVPMAGQTAFHALFEEAGLDAGQRVLVHAAAGGVGHVAVQFAADAGAHVVGTASERNEAYLRELGVDTFVNYREDRVEDVIDPVDVVVDAVGGEVLERSAAVVRPGGVVVTLPNRPPETLVEEFEDEYDVTVRFFDVTTDSDPETLRRVSDRIESGAVEPTITDTYPLRKAQEALDRSADGHVRGKLVLTVTDEG
ncbi:NADP-dependent oxidoreductase [Halopelagius longus]|uniref:NADP-dependent oxidoreductase n=1 Tax=Halopelagius longus TaxID=1236180 RepID=A0A1H0YWE8_9EURY|nr:NADP-dependent oxidoreductase [Halopelagius longus]RDI72710.1 NADP-dependent oxidoreductase [Halopelagius longus]SDQ19512.1 NADPH2:quinone reductase [Halopelagius longus]